MEIECGVYTMSCQRCVHSPRSMVRATHGMGVSTGPPFALVSARFFLSFASSMHLSSELTDFTTSRLAMMPSNWAFHVRSSCSTICCRRLSKVSGLYCAAVGKHDAKFLAEHFSKVLSTVALKMFMKPCARGPGVSAMGGARVGEGERESGLVAEGILGPIDVVEHAEDRVSGGHELSARAFPAVLCLHFPVRDPLRIAPR